MRFICKDIGNRALNPPHSRKKQKKGVYTAFARRYINARMPVDYRTQWSRMLGDKTSRTRGTIASAAVDVRAKIANKLYGMLLQLWSSTVVFPTCHAFQGVHSRGLHFGAPLSCFESLVRS